MYHPEKDNGCVGTPTEISIVGVVNIASVSVPKIYTAVLTWLNLRHQSKYPVSGTEIISYLIKIAISSV